MNFATGDKKKSIFGGVKTSNWKKKEEGTESSEKIVKKSKPESSDQGPT